MSRPSSGIGHFPGYAAERWVHVVAPTSLQSTAGLMALLKVPGVGPQTAIAVASKLRDTDELGELTSERLIDLVGVKVRWIAPESSTSLRRGRRAAGGLLDCRLLRLGVSRVVPTPQ